MNLKTVSLTNLKGVTATYPLTPITIITGDNASGKSAIENAIRIGLLGYHNRLGRQHQATFTLAGKRETMGVTLDFGQDGSITRSWTPKAVGQPVAYKENIPAGFRETPVILLDLDEYMTMTGKERTAYAFRQLQTDGAVVVKRLQEACGLLEVFPSQISAREEMAASLQHHIKATPNAQLLMEALVLAYEEKRKNANRMAKESGQALLRMPLMSPAPVDCSQDLEDLQTSERTVAGESGAILSTMAGLEAMQRQHAEIVAGLERSANADESIAKLQSAIDAFKDDSEAKEAVLAKITADYRTTKAKIEAIQKNQDLLLGRLEHIKDSSVCPTCGAKKAGWKSAAQLEINEELRKISGVRASHEIELSRLTQEGIPARLAAQEAKRSRQIHQQNCDAMMVQKVWQAQRQSVVDRAQDLARQISEAGDTAVMRNRLQEIQQRQVVLTQKRAGLFTAQQAYASNQEMKRRRADTEREQISHTNTAEVAGKFLVAVTAVQQAVLNETFGQLLNVANLFCDGILKSPLVYRDGEIGRMEHDTFIPANAVLFSGMEQRLAFMALQVALASTAPFKLVCIDEMGTFGLANKGKVACRLYQLMQRNIIDQAILIDLSPEGYPENESISFINIK